MMESSTRVRVICPAPPPLDLGIEAPELSFRSHSFSTYPNMLWESFGYPWLRLELVMRTVACWSPQAWRGSACPASYIRITASQCDFWQSSGAMTAAR